jgi:hypothetical protein
MKMKNNDFLFKNFTGSVDQFLEHTSNIDGDDVEKIVVDQSEDVMLNPENAVEFVKNELHCSDEEARRIVEEIQREEADKAISSLIERGLIEVSSYKDGEPLYSLTDAGEKYAEKIKKNV